jgi:hypothetical protein
LRGSRGRRDKIPKIEERKMAKLMVVAVLVVGSMAGFAGQVMAQGLISKNIGSLIVVDYGIPVGTIGMDAGYRNGNIGIQGSVTETGDITTKDLNMAETGVKGMNNQDIGKAATGLIESGVGLIPNESSGDEAVSKIKISGDNGVDIYVTNNIAVTMKLQGTLANVSAVSVGMKIKF